MKKIVSTMLLLIVLVSTRSQPANEINCFQHFQYDYVGNSRINAYLLMQLNYWIYPTAIVGVDDDGDPRVKALQDPKKFLAEYRKKVAHYFFNPNAPITPILNNVVVNPAIQTVQPAVSKTVNTSDLRLNVNRPPYITFVNYNGNNGYDPEVAVISTDQYMIVVFRGTDRVASDNQTPVIGSVLNGLTYYAAEWITSDFNFLQTTPLEGLPGKVHTGFNTSLNFIKSQLEDTLVKYGVANKKLWITGHSLGAAQAQLFGVYERKKNPSWDIRGVYAYAAPHVGDATFVGQMNQLLPGARLQRFDFMDDPITNLPAYYMGYQRAGIRNLYTKEQGANYNYDTKEASSDIAKFMFCLHHTEWYTRAAFYELIDHNPELQGKIPNAPSRPTSFCTQIDVAYATGSSNLLTAGGTDLPEGTYLIKLAQGDKYLNAPHETADQNGTQVQLFDLGNANKNNQWIVKKVPNAIIDSYTIQCADQGKYVDADFLNTEKDGCKVQLWERGLVGFRTNQEWKIVRLTNGLYQIINVKSDSKALDVVNNCTGQNNCKVQLTKKSSTDATQQWYFVRVQ